MTKRLRIRGAFLFLSSPLPPLMQSPVSQSETTSVAPPDKWVNNLPLAYTREIGTIDRQRLQDGAAASLRDCFNSLAGAIFSSTVFAGLCWWLFLWQDTKRIWFALGLGLPLLFIIGYVSLVSLSAFINYRENKKALAVGRIDIFEGKAPRLPNDSEDAQNEKARKLSLGSIEIWPEADVRLEVFSTTGLLWRVNGNLVEGRAYVNVRTTQPPHPRAAMVANWATPVTPNQQGLIFFGRDTTRRPLSKAERKEISRFSRFAILLRLGYLAFAFICLGLIEFFPFDAFVRWADVAQWVALVTVVWAIWQFIKDFPEMQKLHREAKLGFVFVVRVIDQEASENEGIVREYLPLTTSVWTENGAAAPWRRLSELDDWGKFTTYSSSE